MCLADVPRIPLNCDYECAKELPSFFPVFPGVDFCTSKTKHSYEAQKLV